MEHQQQHNRTTPNPRSKRKHSNATEFQPHRVKSREDIGYSHRNPLGATIRTVTPDSIPEGHAVSAVEVEQRFIPGTQTSQPTSPKSGVRESPSQGNTGVYRLRSGSNNDNRHGMIIRDQARPRTRTLDERGHRDSSPPGAYSKSKHRIGSGHSISSSSFNTAEDAVTSIGHPAIIPPPWSIGQRAENINRHRVSSKPPSRDPESNPATNSSGSNGRLSQTSHDGPPPTDTRKMLALMKSARGRMEGPLAFRRSGTTPWAISYCSINDEAGSLVYEPNSPDLHFRTLIPDLRGCNIKPQWDAESHMPYLDIGPQNSKLKIHLRPHSQDEFDSWFAALLCWQPIRPKGIHNRMAKPVSTAPSERRLTDSRRHSEISLTRDSPIIKVGKMIFWDTNVSYSYAGTPKGGKPQPSRMQSFGSRRWRRVSCTLRENGELKLYSEQDVVTMVSCVQLSQLCRSAVQRLDPSVLDNDFCLAIYPQYSSIGSTTTASSSSQPLLRPIFLSLESRVLYEVWLVLLRAFTIPQLYGPKQILSDGSSSSDRSMSSGQSPPVADVFRMERSLSIRVIESRLALPISPELQDKSRSDKDEKRRKDDGKEKEKEKDRESGAYYAEVLLDGETRSKTMIKTLKESLFWREEFEFVDLPAVLSVASIVLKKRPPSTPQNERSMQKEQRRIHDAINSGDGGGGQTGLTFDTQIGKVDIYLDDLEAGKAVEKWWPLVNTHGQSVGEILVSITTEESVILMARDYQPLSELLHRFSNGLTLQIAQMVSSELKRLSECLLNIFQVSSCAGEWIMSLIEEEIDGTFRETPASRTRLSRRAGSNDSGEGTQFGPPLDRELLVRDLGKTATVEANLLFRGNTLLTKSLDLHMKRLGKEYLDETLGDKLKEIADKDPVCEVDPNRVDNLNDLDRNWRKLINWTSECWKCIYNSAAKCPPELRIIFRHIRSCAEERYGNFLKTVSYSSVSGFLFLRFFCPAILNPKLFGLLKDHPKANARRTLTLIAKSLQGLANLNTFGSKEQWMEPMNTFLSSHRQEFKTFLDNVCSISTSSLQLVPIPPSYSTPLAILNRLPLTSKEGFPSLPYLVDHARNFAGLVNLWLDHAGQVGNIQDTDGDLLKFHLTCIALRQRTEDCLSRAERAECPSSSHSVKWEELVENLENGMGYARRQHSRMNSASTSVAEERHSDDPHSPTHERDASTDLSLEPTTRTRSKHELQQQPQQSSPSSHATSPYPTSDSQNEDDFTPVRSPQEEYLATGYASVGKAPSRTQYGNYGSYPGSGFVQNPDLMTSLRDIPRVGSRQASSHQQQLQQHLQQMQSPKRGFTPVHAVPQPTSRIGNTPGDRSGTHFEATTEDRSWLGDATVEDHGWSEERQSKSENERAAFNNTPHNVRPTRRPQIQQRQAQVQLEAELMDPGQSRDRRTIRGEPRRDWAGEERQKRVERTEGANPGNSREGGSSLASMMAGMPLRPASRSQPASRGESRQVSSSSSDNEGTTALPKIKQAAEKDKEAKFKDKHGFGLFSKKKKG